jgi:hypothetical protein
MPNSFDSSTSSIEAKALSQPSSWLRVGAVAAASALAGGLVAAWWYRKTITRLRQAEENGENPYFGIPHDEPADEA